MNAYVLDVEAIRAYEDYLVSRGASLEALMELAGTELALRLHRDYRNSSYLFLLGPGNNGGDGWICADELAKRGAEVRIVCAQTPEEISNEYIRERAKSVVKLGLPIFYNPSLEELDELYASSSVVVDALFGIGFHGDSLPEPYAQWVELLNSFRSESCYPELVCVDVPSGMNPQSGALCKGAVQHADKTITMFAAKPGFIGSPQAEHLGEVQIAKLGINHFPQDCLDELKALSRLEVLDENAVSELIQLPFISSYGDKYARGTLLVVAGSSLYPGAALLCAQAAERTSAGYVILAVPQSIAGILQAQLPTIPIIALPCDKQGNFAPEAVVQLRGLCKAADAVVAGPGMGSSEGSQALVRCLLDSNLPLVLDADALTCLTKLVQASLIDSPHILRREAPLLLSPHAGELKKLCAEKGFFGPYERMDRGARLAQAVGSHNFMLLSKGAFSFIFGSECSLLAPSKPNPQLSKAGMGDVLSGVLGSFMATNFARNEFNEEYHSLHERLSLLEIIVTAVSMQNLACSKVFTSSFGAQALTIGSNAQDLIALLPGLYEEIWLRKKTSGERRYYMLLSSQGRFDRLNLGFFDDLAWESEFALALYDEGLVASDDLIDDELEPELELDDVDELDDFEELESLRNLAAFDLKEQENNSRIPTSKDKDRQED